MEFQPPRRMGAVHQTVNRHGSLCSRSHPCTLPGVRPWLYCAHWAPPWPHLAKYDVCILAGNYPDKQVFVRGPKRNQPHIRGADFFLESGNVLLSRAVSSQVPSALKGLTSVFGMGTGGPFRHCHRNSVKGLCSPRSSWLPLRLFITEASILENSRTICALLLFARTLKTAHPDFLHLAKNQSLTSIFPLVSLDSQFLWIKSSTD